MPLIYALMSSKFEEVYTLFQELIDFDDECNIDLQPQFIITDLRWQQSMQYVLNFKKFKIKDVTFIYPKIFTIKYKNLDLQLSIDLSAYSFDIFLPWLSYLMTLYHQYLMS
jgi:hypothetical protein